MSTPARILMVEGDTVPPAPTVGQVLLYAKTNNTFYSLNSLGVETPLGGGGAGVTSVSVTTANGISGSVANPTTTPAITLTLGAITPSSVAASGTVTGTNLSGTNTGDQTITLTGDITGSGTGSFATTLSNSGATAGTYGSGTQVPVVTVDAKGRITSVSNTSITAGTPGGTVTGAIQLRSAGGTFTADDTFSYAANTLNIAGPVGIGTISSGGELRISNESTGDDFSVRSGADINLFANAAGNGSIRLYTDAVARITINDAGAVAFNSSFGTAGQVLTSQGSGTPPTWTAVGGGSGTVTSVAATGSQGVTIGGSPITTSGTITVGLGAITPTSVAASGTVTGSNLSGTNTGDQTSVTGNAGTATTLQTGRTLAITGDLSWTSPTFNGSGNVTAAGTLATVNSNVGTFGSATQVPVFTVNAKGLVTAVSNVTISGGSGTVTSVAATGSSDITVGGSPITTSGTLTFALANTAVTPATYGSATQVPVFAVDAKGRITSVTNTAITGGSSSPEIVVFNYGSGGSGNFTPGDAIFSQTPGVTATVTDGANCIATYAFTGKSNPPKSITTYGQVFATNEFTIKDTTSLPSAKVAGGGTAAAPDIRTAFSATNIVTLQTRMSDTGASAGLGQRAWLMVVFGF